MTYNGFFLDDGSNAGAVARHVNKVWIGWGISLALLMAAAASAQPAPTPTQPALPTENVTVSGTRSREVIRDFASSFATHTQIIGKIARWETGICAITVGMPPDANKFVTERLKEVAGQVGAPVSTDKACKHNIEIVFTKTPQALLDNIKKNQETFLGYHDSPEQRDRLAAVKHPIQAWYATATQDLNGVLQVDTSTATSPGRGLLVQLPCQMLGDSAGARGANAICTRYLPYAGKYNSSGFQLGDGLRSDFYNIIIVADTPKVGNQELDAVSDYITMLALTQPLSLDACPPLSSIMSLLAKDCGSHAGHLTDVDMSYLEAVYKMDPERNTGIQELQIADQMDQLLLGK